MLSIFRKKVTNHFNRVLLSSIIVVQWLILMHPLSSEEADYLDGTCFGNSGAFEKHFNYRC